MAKDRTPSFNNCLGGENMTLPKTKQPKKQRKRLYQAPLHLRNKRMTAPLSKSLREKYGIKRLPVHKGDKVSVFRAKSEDQEIKGKVIRTLPQKYSIHVEGHSKEKADGTIVSFPIRPSNVVITGLNLKDKKRREIIRRRSEIDLSEEEFEESVFDEEELGDEISEDYDMAEDETFEEEFEDLEVDELKKEESS